MGYFDSKRNVDAYVRMAAGYDGSVLVAVLERHLPAGSSVLEIGMGPGKDLHLLRRRFHPTGSDRSAIFVDHVRAAQPEADVLLLDAVTMQTDRRFDAVYSNSRVEDWRADGRVRWQFQPLSRWSAVRLPWSRFQPPPRQTQHADFPHYAFLPASRQGLCGRSRRERFQSSP